MEGLKISFDELFINNLLSNIIKQKKVKEIKKLNIKLDNNSVDIEIDLFIFNKETKINSNFIIDETPHNFSSGKLVLIPQGEIGVKKIFEGIFALLSKITDSVISDEENLVLDFSKLPIENWLKDSLRNLYIDKFYIKDGEFEIHLKYNNY